MNEEREIHGARYARDTFGWIWLEVNDAPDGQPHWIKTVWGSFDEIEWAMQ